MQSATRTRAYGVGEGAEDPGWQALLAAATHTHHVQTDRWAQVRTSIGRRFDRVVIDDGGDPVAGLQLQVVRVPVVGRLAVGISGPVFCDESTETRERMADALGQAMAERRYAGILIQGNVIDDAWESALEAASFVPSPVTPQLGATAVVDLRRPLDEVRAGMKSKTRYNIRLGHRRGATVRQAGPEGPEVLATLLRSTAERQGFSRPMGARELTAITEIMSDDPIARIFLVDRDGDVVSGALLIGHGETVVYKRGAWDGRHGDARPNEVLHDHMIGWAHDSGYAFYDFDGIDGALAAEILRGESPTATGVARFKLNFGPILVPRPPARIAFRAATARVAFRLAERLDLLESPRFVAIARRRAG